MSDDDGRRRAELGFLDRGGEMGRRIEAFDWDRHPLGPPAEWPRCLKSAVQVMLTSRYAMWMGWGPQLTFFCNDAYLPTVGLKESWVLGASARSVWAEIWDDVGPRVESVMRTGEATWDEGLMLLLERSGYREETYHTFSYSPVADDAWGTGGMLCVVTEETERVLSERRMDLLRQLSSSLAGVQDEPRLFEVVESCLADGNRDVPFALVYLAGDDGLYHLRSTAGIERGGAIAPEVIDPGGAVPSWLSNGVNQLTPTHVVEVPHSLGDVPTSPWDRPPESAALVALPQQGQDAPAGLLAAGLNPYRDFDSAYAGFIELLGGQVATGLANARAYEAERRRAEALAELDRAKTVFFSNVSHEFRTPLTLMLGPLADVMESRGLSADTAERLGLVRRNAERMLKLTNNLLDFSRIEAGRIEAVYEPVNLPAYTADLASVFRAAIERAGMRYIVDCPPMSEPVYIDRDMWEKIVLNLVSNAFKYTLEGEIEVSVRAGGGQAELAVRDTGIGVPASEVPHLFERFYRVEGPRGRAQEGSGIGLALVQELVQLQGGRVDVTTREGSGSTFRVTLPLGNAHLPPERIGAERTHASSAVGPRAYLSEALGWLSRDTGSPPPPDERGPGRGGASNRDDRPTVLLADDNADMRTYVGRLLGGDYRVVAVPDGAAALSAARSLRPDLVLTDVMMPNVDGFRLLEELRAAPETESIPVIMLSARAGEEARSDGLQAGADDYLVKPFGARELRARVDGVISLARLRREASEREADLRAASLERFQVMADHAPVMVWMSDVEGGCSFVSQSWYDFSGVEPDTGLGRGWIEAIHPDDREWVAGRFAAAHRTREPVQVDYRLRHRDGGYRWATNTAAPHADEDGAFRGFIGSVMDISDRKEMEESLHSLIAELERSNEAKSEMLGFVSHEFRTPVTIISGNLDRLVRRFDSLGRASIEASLIEVRANADRLKRLVQNMLVLARGETPAEVEMEPILVQRIIEGVAATEQARDRTRLLHLDLAEDLPPVLGSQGYLEQVLENLIANARKYGTPATPITIDATLDDGDVVIAVCDYGDELDAADVAHFFEPFYRADKHKALSGGTGLGLAVCRKLVNLLGGKIEAQPRPGGGLMVSVRFPALPDPGM